MGKVDQGVFTHWMLAHHFGGPLTYIGFGGSGQAGPRPAPRRGPRRPGRRAAARPRALGREHGQRRRRPRVQPLAAGDDRDLPRADRQRGPDRDRASRPGQETSRSTSTTARSSFADRVATEPRAAQVLADIHDWIGRRTRTRAARARDLERSPGRGRTRAMPVAIVTGSGGLIGSESVAPPGRGRASTWSGSRTTCGRASSGRRPRPRTSPSGSTANLGVPHTTSSTSATPRASNASSPSTAATIELVDPHRRAALPRLGRARAADRLRRQRQRHPEPARGDPRHCPGGDLHLHLDQQGLRRHAQPAAAGGAGDAAGAARGPPLLRAASTRRCRSTPPRTRCSAPRRWRPTCWCRSTAATSA